MQYLLKPKNQAVPASRAAGYEANLKGYYSAARKTWAVFYKWHKKLKINTGSPLDIIIMDLRA